MKKLTPWYFLVLLLATSCIGSEYRRLRAKSGTVVPDFEAQIPFDYSHKVLVVQVTIKGKKYPFIFDTGAASTVVSKALAKELGLEVHTSIKTRDSRGQTQRLAVGLIDTLHLDEVGFINSSAIIVDFPHHSAVECISWAGILGNNIIRHANWKVNYQDEILYLSSKTIPTDSNTLYTPMLYAQSRPHLNIDIDSFSFQSVLLDLGSAGGVDIREKTAKEQMGKHFKTYLVAKEIDGSTQGLFGAKPDSNYIGRGGSLHMAGLEIKQPILELGNSNSSKIGNKLLEHFELYLDYSGERIGFKPLSKDLSYAYQETFGCIPMPRDSSFYVASLQDIASNGLLHLGDTILELNGRSMASFNYDFCEAFFFIRQTILHDSLTLRMKGKPEKPIILQRRTY